MARTLPPLPNELWTKILENLCDSEQRPDAWISYRNVSKAFKEIIELIFREKHLPKTRIGFDTLGIYYNDDDEKVILACACSFTRLSDDKTLAIFTIPAVEEYHDVVRERLMDALEHATFEHPCHYVQIRHDVNDTPIPDLSVDYEKFEVSCDWRGLYTQFYSEEHRYNQRTQNWVKEKESWVEDLKVQMARGELNMLSTLEKAMYAFADGSHESRRLVRRARIRRQYREDGDAWDFDRNGNKEREIIDLKLIARARKRAAWEEFSDDDSGEEGADSLEAGEDEWEDDEDEFDDEEEEEEFDDDDEDDEDEDHEEEVVYDHVEHGDL